MTEQQLIEKLTHLGLCAYFEQLKPHLRNAIHLEISAQAESDIPIGVSKIGGLPDLPDSGRLYFWIKTEDLKERRFDRMWMILQCT